jgi:hypothetical protein
MSDERRKRAVAIVLKNTVGISLSGGVINAMLDFADEEVANERARYSALAIHPPNDSGNTMCIVRWMVDTPHGWIGSWDRAALDNVVTVNNLGEKNHVDK